MGLRDRSRRRVTVVNKTVSTSASDIDIYGNPEVTDTVATEYAAWVSQTSSSENNVNRQTARASWTVLLPPEAVVDNSSILEFDEESCRVLGVPNPVHNSRGLHHYEVLCESIEG